MIDVERWIRSTEVPKKQSKQILTKNYSYFIQKNERKLNYDLRNEFLKRVYI